MQVGALLAGAAGWVAWIVDPALHEAMLLAGVLFLIGGSDDLLVDLIWLVLHRPMRRFENLPLPEQRGRLAVFVPAWDEAAVIGGMLTAALSRYRHDDYRLYVGCYPNDRVTIAAVAAVAAGEPRVRLVIGERQGPTTKADCLNTLWRELLRADAADRRETRAVVLHDAEDVVDPYELALADRLLDRHALIQLPVMPLIAPESPLVSGHYADEFAYAHQVALEVRARVGAGLPLAGVGCIVRRDALEALAGDGTPFEEASLTEDYELGLRVAQLGLPGCFARVLAPGSKVPIATRAYFPDRVGTAVVQKARWMTGIALSGWDRTGWGARLSPVEWWMRMRDRRAILGVVALALGYLAVVGWALSAGAHALAGSPQPGPGPWLLLVLQLNFVLLAWRLAMRAAMTGRLHGWREAAWSLPRALVGNYIAMLAARRAVLRYVAILAGQKVRWDKTAHRFPDLTPVPQR